MGNDHSGQYILEEKYVHSPFSSSGISSLDDFLALSLGLDLPDASSPSSPSRAADLSGTNNCCPG